MNVYEIFLLRLNFLNFQNCKKTFYRPIHIRDLDLVPTISFLEFKIFGMNQMCSRECVSVLY